MATEKKYLDLEGLKTYNEQVKSLIDTKETSGTAATKVKELADGQVKANTNAIATLNGTGAGSVSKAVSDAKADTENKIGTLANLTTSKKTDLVSAVNEIKSAVGDTKTAGEVTVDTTTTTAGMSKSYTLKQNGKNIATIDIPKDMVVSSGEVKTYTAQTLPTGTGAPTTAGTYLVLTLANATNDKMYVNVGTLVDIYKAKANATQVQIAIDASTREISASVVAGSIGANELADNAVTTVKIADGNVSKAKLATAVQTSLGKADTAVQSVKTGTVNGTIAVDGKDVAVKGLGSAAYTATTAYEKSGAVTALANGQVATNKNDIASLKTKVATLEGTTYTAISDKEINALFGITE